jgi:hypothetical protein
MLRRQPASQTPVLQGSSPFDCARGMFEPSCLLLQIFSFSHASTLHAPKGLSQKLRQQKEPRMNLHLLSPLLQLSPVAGPACKALDDPALVTACKILLTRSFSSPSLPGSIVLHSLAMLLSCMHVVVSR